MLSELDFFKNIEAAPQFKKIEILDRMNGIDRIRYNPVYPVKRFD
jgi:hypothetical protein